MAVGVDVSVRRRLDVVVLDAKRRLVLPPLARQSPSDLEALLSEYRPAAVAIDSPPAWGIRGRSRQAERELAALGLPCFRTPSDPALRQHPFYAWMLAGHDAFAAADRAGYPLYRGGPSATGCALEVFPHAAAVGLSGWRPPPGTTRRASSKRQWRASVLDAAGVATDRLGSLDAIDAALAALTALLGVSGGPWFALGDPADGLVVVPGRRPAGRYPRTHGAC